MTTESKQPSVEEMVIALKEQIQIKVLQSELQELNTRIANQRLGELEAFAKMHEYSQTPPAPGEVIQHIVTQEDIDNNPEFSAQGIVVGTNVGIPKEVYGNLKLSKVENEPVVEDYQEVKESPLSLVK